MLISIITPTYNSEPTIRNCVQSILQQTYQDYEHIIVDNLSQDNTLGVIRQLYQKANTSQKLKIISEKDEGISQAFNKGITAAKGEIIGILNSDDRLYGSDSLNRIISPFINKDVMFVHGNILMNDPVYGTNIRRPLQCRITKAMPFNHPTLYFRKEIYEKYGYYKMDYKIVMDYEYIMRLFRQNPQIIKKGTYLEGDPLAVMNFGGVSWKRERESLKEIKKALIDNQLWNIDAQTNLLVRKVRFNTKSILSLLHIYKPIRWWRRWKWKN